MQSLLIFVKYSNPFSLSFCNYSGFVMCATMQFYTDVMQVGNMN